MASRARFILTGENRTDRAFRSVDRNLLQTGRMVRNLAASLGLAFGVRGLAMHINTQIRAADEMLKLTRRIGGTTEALSELRFVAERSGVEFTALTMGMQRMVRRVSEAASGFGEAKDALKELGLDAQALEQLALDEQFEVVSQALSEVKNQSDQVRLAMKLFDSEGVQLVQIMGQGAQGIRELREEARKLGVTLSQEDAEAAERASDALTDLKASAGSLSRDFAILLAPAIGDVARGIAIVREQFQGLSNDVRSDVDDQIASLSNRLWELTEALDQAEGARGRNRNESRIARLRQEIQATDMDLRVLQASIRGLDEESSAPSGGGGTALTPILEDIDMARIRAKGLFQEVEIGVSRVAQLSPTVKLGDVFARQASEVESVFEDMGQTVGRTFLDEWTNMLLGAEFEFDDFIKRLVLKAASQKIFSGLAAGAGPVGSFFSFLGFQNGGSFTVGGTGGPDSQLVAFKASPGEDVDIRTPGQKRGGGSVTLNQSNTYNVSGGGDNLVAQLKAEQARNNRALIAEVERMMVRGRF